MVTWHLIQLILIDYSNSLYIARLNNGNCTLQQNYLRIPYNSHNKAAKIFLKIRCAIHKLIISIWNKEELPEEWKGSIIVPIHKKGDKTDCNNYRGISLLPTTYKILFNILLSRLIPYAEEVIGGHQCGF